jgi:flagellar biosynthesis/type III secretory pathway protein FliH
MNIDGPEEREAERLERDTFDHDKAADRADERRSVFAESIFEMSKATTEATLTAYQAGYAVGHHQGYLEAMAKVKELINASFAPVKP